ncbi:MAG: hypothetical protein NC184_06280 [Roseburia sp.]|nr:hypothetical protein [Roseburia sp.]
MSAPLLNKYASLYEKLDILSAVTGEASAYLFSGEDSDGLATLARLAAARVCGLPYSQAFEDRADITVYPISDSVAPQKKSAKGKKPDAQPKRAAVSVDDIRDIVGSLYLTPFELKKHVYIIENAESMSEICQNKLLKSLEEPPAHVCFILCACGRLLPTVESRCIKSELASFDTETVARELSRFYSDRKAIELAARAARGNLGMAERMIADVEFGATYAAALEILKLSDGSRMFGRAAAVYDKFTRERIGAVLGLMEYLLCDIARLLSGGETVFDRSDVESVANGFTAYSAAKCSEHVREAKRRNDANCMPIAVMDTMVIKIMEEKAICRR